MHKISSSNSPSFMHVSLHFQYFTCIRPNVSFFQGLCLHFIFVRCPFPRCQELFTTPVGRFYSCIHNLLKQEPEIISTCDMFFPVDYKCLKGNDIDLLIFKVMSSLKSWACKNNNLSSHVILYIGWWFLSCLYLGSTQVASFIWKDWQTWKFLASLTCLAIDATCQLGFLRPFPCGLFLQLARLAPLHTASKQLCKASYSLPTENTQHHFHQA